MKIQHFYLLLVCHVLTRFVTEDLLEAFGVALGAALGGAGLGAVGAHCGVGGLGS